jgi:hypothetical protein
VANSTVDVPPSLRSLSVDGLSNLNGASISSVAAPLFQVRLAEDLLLEVRIRGRDVLLAHPDLEFDGPGIIKTKASWMDFSTLLWTSAFEVRLIPLTFCHPCETKRTTDPLAAHPFPVPLSGFQDHPLGRLHQGGPLV